jgi:hypothetical protein
MVLRNPAVGGSKGETKTAAKHVVIFGGKPSDGGSIPPASTIRLTEKALARSPDATLKIMKRGEWCPEQATVGSSRRAFLS